MDRFCGKSLNEIFGIFCASFLPIQLVSCSLVLCTAQSSPVNSALVIIVVSCCFSHLTPPSLKCARKFEFGIDTQWIFWVSISYIRPSRTKAGDSSELHMPIQLLQIHTYLCTKILQGVLPKTQS